MTKAKGVSMFARVLLLLEEASLKRGAAVGYTAPPRTAMPSATALTWQRINKVMYLCESLRKRLSNINLLHTCQHRWSIGVHMDIISGPVNQHSPDLFPNRANMRRMT